MRFGAFLPGPLGGSKEICLHMTLMPLALIPRKLSLRSYGAFEYFLYLLVRTIAIGYPIPVIDNELFIAWFIFTFSCI